MERVADYIIRKIKEEGVDHVFMVSGRGILYLTDAVARNKEVTPICTFHEQGASYAAMAYARMRNRPAVCLVSTGCAAANAVTAALCAYQDNLPVVFVSGNNKLNETTRFTGAGKRTYGSQEADIVKIVGSITKYAVMLSDIDEVSYEVEKALYMANEGRKGPVWIDVPLDVQNMHMPEEETLKHYVCLQKENDTLSDDIREFCCIAKKAVRPVLLVGGGAASARESIKDFVEKTGWPVVFSPSAADIYGLGYQMSMGAVGSIGGSRAGNFVLQNSDLVLVIGSKLCSQLTGDRKKFAREAKIAVVDIDESEHDKNAERLSMLITANADEFMKWLTDADIDPASDGWKNSCLHWKSVFAVENEEFVRETAEKDRFELYSFADVLSGYLTEDVTVITDAGFEELIIPSTIRFRSGQRCLFPAAQGAMGYAIPAIAGCYYAGCRNIVCVVGDGSLMMNMQELQLISAMKIPAKIFVINNNMYAVIRKRQKDLFRNRTIGNDPSDGVSKPDFRRIAESFGIYYRYIESISEFKDNACSIFSGNDKPEMIEVKCEPDQQYLHESYTINENRKLVHRPIEDLAPFLSREFIGKEMIIKSIEE